MKFLEQLCQGVPLDYLHEPSGLTLEEHEQKPVLYIPLIPCWRGFQVAEQHHDSSDRYLLPEQSQSLCPLEDGPEETNTMFPY